MRNDSAFLNSIPKFLRRPLDAAPAGLEFTARARSDSFASSHRSRPRTESVIHGGVPPVQPDFGPAAAPVSFAKAPVSIDKVPPKTPATTRLPWLARRKDPSVNVSVPEDSRTPEIARGVVDLTAHRGAADTDEGDAAFQVTLPRGVIRQIRVRAAEEGTTHRAIVLRALRGAGLKIPEGADVDRRALAAKRRHQA